MGAEGNIVFSTALQLCRTYGKTPESVVYGYSKLLKMDEVSVRSILSEEDRKELEEARKLMNESKLDLDLVKSGLPLLIPAIVLTPEQADLYKEFDKFLEEGSAETKSVEILEKALKTTMLPMEDLFTEGHSMDDAFNYLKVLKEKKKAEVKEEAPAEKKPESSETKEPEVKEKKTFKALAEKYRNLSSSLLDVVKGQNHAVSKFVQGCFQGEVLQQKENKKQPRSYFFFFGPPGTGKTLLAETAAECMGLPHMRFNMSEYASNQSHEGLIGVSPFYQNAKDGTLVKFVRQNPECLLIFDEIEKSHINVIRLFLQILGSGKLRSAFTEEDVSFEKTVVIFTSNVGKELYADRSCNLTTLPAKVVLSAIQSEKGPTGGPVLPAEICSRVAAGNMIMFNHLSLRHLVDMADANFRKISENMEDEYGVHITYANELPLLFLYNRGGGIDARVAQGQSGGFLKNEIFELTRQMEKRTDEEEITSIHFDIDWEGMDGELSRLFVNEGKADVLFLANRAMKESISFDTDRYTVHWAESLDEAREHLKKDITAVFINPFFGKRTDNKSILSISDYNTDGVVFFHELAEKEADVPIYLLEVEEEFSEVDRRTFLQEGAFDTLVYKKDQASAFLREFEQLMEELYMEKESQIFSQRGWVIDFKSRQDVSSKAGEVKVLFYDLKKRMAVDMESRDAVLSEADRPNIKFEDVIGAENAKEELQYFISYLTNPKEFVATGGKPPKGVLLYGPPGTGKTMLAKAMAGESDVAFFETSAAEFKNSYIGQSEENIRSLFKKARKYAPAIIFIDEIDAIGKQRTGRDLSTESMLNALLTEMDGFGSNSKKPVFVLAATNYGVGEGSDGIASLDSALIRRFDNKIYVDLPNRQERKKYLSVLTKKYKLTSVSDTVLDNIAERTTGQSLAILQNIFDLAFRNATKAKKVVDDNDLLNSMEDYIYGEKRESTPEYYRSVAIHELGHAYISYLNGNTPSYITIESRGNFGGYMMPGAEEDVNSYSKEDLLGKIRVSLAGRGAEQVFFGKDVSLNTGASSDLRKASQMALHIICTYGMEEGHLITLPMNDVLKSAMAEQYVKRANDILIEQMQRTIADLEAGKEVIQKLADVLVAQSHLTGEEFKALMKEYTS